MTTPTNDDRYDQRWNQPRRGAAEHAASSTAAASARIDAAVREGMIVNQASTGVLTEHHADHGQRADESTVLLGAPRREDGRLLRGLRILIALLLIATAIVVVGGSYAVFLEDGGAGYLGGSTT